jgi:CheY-like chemotaxis protein
MAKVPLQEMTIRLIKRILLVEDAQEKARLFKEMIKEGGARHVEVTHVESMKEAEEPFGV